MVESRPKTVAHDDPAGSADDRAPDSSRDLGAVLDWLSTERSDPREPEFLNRLADRLAVALDVERVAIARVYDSILPPSVLWVAAATDRWKRDSSGVLPLVFAKAAAALGRGQCWRDTRPAEDATIASMATAGTDAWEGCALAPIMVDGALWGFIAIAHPRAIRNADLASLQRVAGGLSTCVTAGPAAPARSESLVGDALMNIGEPLVVYDADLRVAWHNDAWQRSLSYMGRGENLIGVSLLEITRVNVEKGYWTPARADEVYRDFASRRFAISRERTTSIGGTHLRHRNYPLPGGGFVGIRTDVTDLVLRQYELSEARGRAEATSKAKSTFLAAMSHELRTPLNAIIGFSELMGSGMLGRIGDERHASYLADIHRSGKLLLSLINDLLDMARIEAGKVELDPAPISVHEVLTDVIRLVDLQARQNDLALTLGVGSGLPPINVDRRATAQILLNIVSNAIKFTQRGGRISVLARLESPAMLCVAVGDNGPGIDPRDLPRLGRPFERLDDEKFGVAQRNRGTGLGLAISRSLAEHQGGALRIRSELGKGTTVEVLLPVAGTPPSRASAMPPPG